MESKNKSPFIIVPEKYGHAVFPVLESGLKAFQEKRNNEDGAYLIEILQSCQPGINELKKKAVPQIGLLPCFAMMIQKDWVYMNEEFNKYSLVPLPGYQKWSERLAEKMPGLVWNPQTFRLDQGSAETLNYDDLMKLWLNRDQAQLQEEQKHYEELVAKQSELFLDGSKDIPRVFLASLQRSGNTYFRKLLEQTSGLVTGTDMISTLSSQHQLILKGFKGEGVVDSRTLFGKTHFPYTLPNAYQQSGTRTILVVRNPVENALSNIHFAVNQTQDKSCCNDLAKEFPKEWDFCVKFYVRKWKEFNQYWLTQAREKKMPVLVLRFEDLAREKEKYLKEAYAFMLGVDSIDGTYLESRIKHALTLEQKTIYKPREKKEEKLGPQYLTFIEKICREQLIFFGYAAIDNKENPTGWFKYDEVSEEERASYFGFEQLNSEMKQWYVHNKEQLDQKPFTVYKPGEDLNIPLPDEPQSKMTDLRMKISIRKE